jgi:CBS domain-containing protein
MTIVETLMKTELVTAAADETVAHAAGSMARNEVGAVLVIEEERLVGVLSERDVVARIVAEGSDPAQVRVVDAATADVVAVDVGASVRECAELLRAKGIRHLPVLRDGKPVGVLSSRDFFAYVVEELQQLVERGQYQQALDDGQDPYDHLGGSYGS